jgi:hypothetical protein
MIPAPKTKAEELIAEIASLLPRRGQIDAFTVRRLKREIEQARAVDTVTAYRADGMLGVLEWSVLDIESAFNSVMQFTSSASLYVNFAACFQLLGQYFRASELMMIASDLEPTNLTTLRKSAHYSLLAGRFDVAQKISEVFDVRSPGESVPSAEVIRDAIFALNKAGLPTSTVIKCNRIAFDFLVEKKVPFTQTRYKTDKEDASTMLLIEIGVNEDLITLLDRDLGERLFDQIEDYRPSLYWVGYIGEVN